MDPGPDGPARPGMIRATVNVSLVTASARLLGFARWVVFGLTVGATYLGNAYQTANWVPNILFELVAGGILASVFVPTFLSTLEESKDRAETVASTMANLFLLASIPLVAAAMLFGRPIMGVLTAAVPDPLVRERQMEVGAFFLLFFAPQIPLYLLGMLLRSLLYAHDRVVLPAAAPAFGSAVTILAYLGFRALGPGADLGTVTDLQLIVLAGGTTLGVVAWAFSQMPAVWRLGIRWRPVLRVRDPAVRQALRAGGNGLVFTVITQIGFVAILILTNRVRGGVVAFQVAFAFYELPNAVAAFPISTSLYPSLARYALQRRTDDFARLLSRGIRAQFLLVVPAAVGLAVLGEPLLRLVFGWGPAAQTAPELISVMLVSMVLGLPAFAGAQLIVRGFWARDEMRPSLLVNAVTVATAVAGMVTATAVTVPAGSTALATVGAWHAAGQWAGFAFGFLLLARRVPEWSAGRDAGALAATVLRAAAMAAVVWGVMRLVEPAGVLLALAGSVVAGIVFYTALSIRTPELRMLRSGPGRITDPEE